MKKTGLRIDFNSPVILGFTFISFAVLVLGLLSGGFFTSFFAVYRTSWADPTMYLRLFTHIVDHKDLAHFTGNFLLILAVGPLVEEKYGSQKLAVMIGITAVITGLINVIFFPRVALLGASGIVFMLILLASFTNIRERRLPLTVIIVAVLYIGNEVVTGLLANDSISQLSHIIGGLCGACFGYFLHKDKFVR